MNKAKKSKTARRLKISPKTFKAAHGPLKITISKHLSTQRREAKNIVWMGSRQPEKFGLERK
jgi:hypothetical protein